MTHLWENERLPAEHDNGVELTDFRASSAASTQVDIYLWDQQPNVSNVLQVGLNKDVGIGCLDITIQTGYRKICSGECLRESSSNGRFSGATFPASDCNDQCGCHAL
jgi:hypothetical protein